jgi:hypothetical protein
MEAILARTAELPATPPAQRRFHSMLSALAQAALKRLTLPQRDVPAEFFHFPLP